MADGSEHERFPFLDLLSMELKGDEAGTGISTVDVLDKHRNPNGVAHGAVLFALADTAMGRATMSVLDEGVFCATIELSLRFIRPVRGGTVLAEATLLKRGRHVVHLDARVHDSEDRLIARADGIFAIIDGTPR